MYILEENFDTMMPRDQRPNVTENKVSVLMPAYNAGVFIDDAITSCLTCLDNPEVIVVNDGSTDQTGDILGKYVDHKNVKISSFTENRGKVAALNHGYSIASGNIITLLAADDIMMPGRNRLSHIKILSQQPQFFIGNMIAADAKLRTIQRIRKGVVKWPKILEGNFYPGGAIAFNRSFGESVFPIPMEISSEDYFMALSACFLGCEEGINEDFITYRLHDGGTWGSMKKSDMMQAVALRNITIFDAFSSSKILQMSPKRAEEFLQLKSSVYDYNYTLSQGWEIRNLTLALMAPSFYSLKSRIRLALGARSYARLQDLYGRITHHHRP